MTTHSPYIVDELESSAVCVMATNQAGEVVAQSLAQHPDAQKALQVLTTGEFLSAEGENWVLGLGESAKLTATIDGACEPDARCC